MHRCWLDTDTPLAVSGVFTLSQEESGHLLKSLRMRPGDDVQILAAKRLYEGEIASAGGGIVSVRVRSELPSPEPAVRVTLLQGLPKADKLEFIVQKATELGADRIQPVEMARSVARISATEEQKRERLARIALEAAKQAGRARVPQVLRAVRLEEALQTLRGTVYVAWEEAAALRLSQALAEDRPEEITLVIGPEGGIAAEEIARLVAAGAKPVTLGPRILRTETAGLCALAVIMAAFGDM